MRSTLISLLIFQSFKAIISPLGPLIDLSDHPLAEKSLLKEVLGEKTFTKLISNSEVSTPQQVLEVQDDLYDTFSPPVFKSLQNFQDGKSFSGEFEKINHSKIKGSDDPVTTPRVKVFLQWLSVARDQHPSKFQEEIVQPADAVIKHWISRQDMLEKAGTFIHKREQSIYGNVNYEELSQLKYKLVTLPQHHLNNEVLYVHNLWVIQSEPTPERQLINLVEHLEYKSDIHWTVLLDQSLPKTSRSSSGTSSRSSNPFNSDEEKTGLESPPDWNDPNVIHSSRLSPPMKQNPFDNHHFIQPSNRNPFGDQGGSSGSSSTHHLLRRQEYHPHRHSFGTKAVPPNGQRRLSFVRLDQRPHSTGL